LVREEVFYLSSDDYYDTANYATRLIGDNLVLYTPVDLTQLGPGQRLRVPRLRRGAPRGGGRGSEGEALFGWTDIHRPLQFTLRPMIHSVTVCPLDRLASGQRLVCRTRAFVGPPYQRFYVTPTDIFLMLAPDLEDTEHLEDATACAARTGGAVESVVYRIPIARNEPSVTALRGTGFDQFSLDVHDGRLRALLDWMPVTCEPDSERPPRSEFVYAEVPLSRFASVLRHVPDSAYSPLPWIGGSHVANRFTDTHLVYAPLASTRLLRSDNDRDQLRPAVAVVVPLDRADDARILQLDHNVIRMERAGDQVVVTGYRDTAGLSLSLIDVAGLRTASTLRLPGRFESEGRSHAFNLTLAPDRRGVMGLPTVRKVDGSEYWPSRSSPSDISFLQTDSEGRLVSTGTLASGLAPRSDEAGEPDGEEDEDDVPGYSCEVSCVDWYGNSRPIFTDGRIFALTGPELIEGRLQAGGIDEVRRLNITRAPQRTEGSSR
jgi:hypothetical protein